VPQRFFIEYPLWDAKLFAHTCQNVYFPTNEYSIATWIVVNVGLFYLFRDLDKRYLTQVGTTRQEAKAYVDLCTANALTCIQNLRLCLDATIDNVEGLALAASHSAVMCQTLLTHTAGFVRDGATQTIIGMEADSIRGSSSA
jgi:hypothetical protein